MKKILTLIGVVALITTLAACEGSAQTAAERAQAQNIAAQSDIISRATASIPVPRVDNFLARENLAEYMRRMDDPAKTWYIYVIANNGAKLGYYVASTYPQSVCTFMTPPEQVKEIGVRGSGANPIAITTAPALDGVYYKGGGCDTKFFFDVSSDAMILISGMNLWTSDVPLAIDTPRIEVAVTTEEEVTE